MDVEGWEELEQRDREEGISHTGKNVSKSIRRQGITGKQQGVRFWLPRCMKKMKKGMLQSLTRAR